jgi:hypothetical protein
MKTTLVFRTSQYRVSGGERDFLTALKDVVMTPRLALACALDVITYGDACRIGLLEVAPEGTRTLPSWHVKRYNRHEDIPAGAFFEWMPGTVQDTEDDMDVTLNLAPWVGVYEEPSK